MVKRRGVVIDNDVVQLGTIVTISGHNSSHYTMYSRGHSRGHSRVHSRPCTEIVSIRSIMYGEKNIVTIHDIETGHELMTYPMPSWLTFPIDITKTVINQYHHSLYDIIGESFSKIVRYDRLDIMPRLRGVLDERNIVLPDHLKNRSRLHMYEEIVNEMTGKITIHTGNDDYSSDTTLTMSNGNVVSGEVHRMSTADARWNMLVKFDIVDGLIDGYVTIIRDDSTERRLFVQGIRTSDTEVLYDDHRLVRVDSHTRRICTKYVGSELVEIYECYLGCQTVSIEGVDIWLNTVEYRC